MTNIWSIQEYEGDGVSCPITPINLPWHKKVVLFLFRFGICPLCVTSSVGYSLLKAGKPVWQRIAPKTKAV